MESQVSSLYSDCVDASDEKVGSLHPFSPGSLISMPRESVSMIHLVARLALFALSRLRFIYVSSGVVLDYF